MARISGTVPGLTPNTEYEFQVRVVDAYGNPGDWSNVARGTTLGESASFLYINQAVFDTNSIEAYIVDSYAVVTIAGADTFTVRRGSPAEHSYNGRVIIKENPEANGYATAASPDSPSAIASGQWSVIDLIELRAAYPALTTITIEYYFGQQNAAGGDLRSIEQVGAWAHLCSGAYTVWDLVSDEPTYYMPWQLVTSGSPPLNDPSVSIIESSKTNIAGSSVPVAEWPADYPYTLMATVQYDDGTGAFTVL